MRARIRALAAVRRPRCAPTGRPGPCGLPGRADARYAGSAPISLEADNRGERCFEQPGKAAYNEHVPKGRPPGRRVSSVVRGRPAGKRRRVSRAQRTG